MSGRRFNAPGYFPAHIESSFDMTEEDNLTTAVPVARRSRLDLVFGIAITMFAVVFIVWIIPTGVSVPSSVKAAPLSPAFLPYVLSASIALMGIICVLQATLGQGVPKDVSELTFSTRRTWPLRLLLVLGIFAGFYFLPEFMGMLPVAILGMGILLFVGGERNLLRGVLVSILLPLGIWLFFTQVAQVPMPEGLIEGYFSS